MCCIPATILRPAYYMDNDATVKDAITGYGVYPMPIGTKGLAMVDARDVGEVAANELVRRERSPTPLPLSRINLIGPDTLTGTDVVAIWSDEHGMVPDAGDVDRLTRLLRRPLRFPSRLRGADRRPIPNSGDL